MGNVNSLLMNQAQDGIAKTQVKLVAKTVFLYQAEMFELFQTTEVKLGDYIKQIFEEGELSEDAVIRKFRIIRFEGKSLFVNKNYKQQPKNLTLN